MNSRENYIKYNTSSYAIQTGSSLLPLCTTTEFELFPSSAIEFNTAAAVTRPKPAKMPHCPTSYILSVSGMPCGQSVSRYISLTTSTGISHPGVRCNTMRRRDRKPERRLMREVAPSVSGAGSKATPVHSGSNFWTTAGAIVMMQHRAPKANGGKIRGETRRATRLYSMPPKTRS